MSQTRFKQTAKLQWQLDINIFTSARTLSIWSMYQIFSGENLKNKKAKVNWLNIGERQFWMIMIYEPPNHTTKLYNSTFLLLKGRGKQNCAAWHSPGNKSRNLSVGQFQTSETWIHHCSDNKFRYHNSILSFYVKLTR
jgi:hypothetical protein